MSGLIKTNPAGFVHTPTFKIAIPEVIALRVYGQIPVSEIKFTRRNIYDHYGYRCCYCGEKFQTSDLNLEHIIPVSRGGQSTWNNVVTSCIPCNIEKGDRLPQEAGMKLLIKPTRPRWKGAQSLVLPTFLKIKTSWQKFIDNAYWNSEIEE
ncbi:MAG: HNH endonuclease [Elusimicrobia bacterium]|nr:HNH endonuclease [Elusimicrobiota bacterium]